MRNMYNINDFMKKLQIQDDNDHDQILLKVQNYLFGQNLSVLECGSGTGRITKQLLSPICKNLDLIEQSDIQALNLEKNLLELQDSHKIQIYNMGLQDFNEQNKQYDFIWIQWVLSYIKADDIIDFLKKQKKNLKKDGFIVVKENYVDNKKNYEIDDSDYSITRSKELFQQLFFEAGYKCSHQEKQQNLPEEIYDVQFFTLQ
ncbi:hypothetical protein PPERSA_03980 [Pseudocohnilembus persalinus]|uniref:Alpha N-terminal protein methyltransferase 1 n=1 Tax=Pseudocohnilembus persalinus TaxID=266149 RepID=A0A0V0QB93_PSEPJ|nr:hypothetical protein PPERSA_03980 [Pseudocohnilembus persalinus]|eukprot:KRW99510.1 hypothetical protein PPERSA_03980 [Pseudocohnilembus persalinus]